ncbi:membrane hypothetical protein [Nostocoides japonicum T1-X7]|uniref:Uncharacterized protein n=1 Tax=Nostocoides japonicum T1-X7 TaxID=1194083 RepID=A0A077M2P2_9MICO|nr:hypothetical protein [Tetrasphaera japonica]CCH79317.1 membrane hypothetical protein [Tetrasphaera japonica T1-X7]
MSRLWDDVTTPDKWARGHVAVRVAGVYLALVVASWLLLSAFLLTRGSLDTPAWVPLPLLLLTLPLSFTLGYALYTVFYPPPLVGAFGLLVFGVVIAWYLWRVIRGPRWVE